MQPTNEDFAAVADLAYELVEKSGVTPEEYVVDKPDQDPAAKQYLMPIESDQVLALFQVPEEIRTRNPRGFRLSFITPHRYIDEPLSSVFDASITLEYDYDEGDDEATVSYNIWGTSDTIDSEPSQWRGHYYKQGSEDFEVEDEDYSLSIRDLKIMQTIISSQLSLK